MSNYEEIKNLIEASRRALSKNINESSKSQIRRQYGLLNEQMTEKVEFETEASNTPPLLLVLPSPVGHAHSPCHSTSLVTVLPLSQCSPCHSAPLVAVLPLKLRAYSR